MEAIFAISVFTELGESRTPIQASTQKSELPLHNNTTAGAINPLKENLLRAIRATLRQATQPSTEELGQNPSSPAATFRSPAAKYCRRANCESNHKFAIHPRCCKQRRPEPAPQSAPSRCPEASGQKSDVVPAHTSKA